MRVEAADGVRPKARDEDLVVEQVGDELLIYDVERDKAHCLNETAALVFMKCDGERGIEELTALLSDDSGQPVHEEVVRAALVRLRDAHLLDGPASSARERHEWSRRQVLRKVGFAGAAAGLVLPVVKSIVTPTPAEAQASDCLEHGAICNTGCRCTGFGPQNCTPSGLPCCPGLFCAD
jgi:coenzyme PQQ synthesis protein D (PqqD)